MAIFDASYYRCPLPCFNLTWGRQDVADCSKTEPPLPSPKMTGPDMFSYFNAAFGFNKQQVSMLSFLHNFPPSGCNTSNLLLFFTLPDFLFVRHTFTSR